jgi:hypothetical protein
VRSGDAAVAMRLALLEERGRLITLLASFGEEDLCELINAAQLVAEEAEDMLKRWFPHPGGSA